MRCYAPPLHTGPSVSRQLGHHHLCLLKPEAHPHLAIQRGGGGEVLARLLALANVTGVLAEAEVAVGNERAHPAGLGEHQRLAVVGLASLGIEPVGMGRDVAE